MLKWLMNRRLRTFERKHDYDAAYLHEVLDVDPTAFLKFGLATNLGAYRKDVPLDVYFAAALTSSIHADCGPCTQLGVHFALQAGVEPSVVAAIITDDEVGVSSDVALGLRFAKALLNRSPEIDTYRQRIVQVWGPRAVLALTFAVMTAQLYPALKYALGYGKACTRVLVADRAFTPRRLVTGLT